MSIKEIEKFRNDPSCFDNIYHFCLKLRNENFGLKNNNQNRQTNGQPNGQVPPLNEIQGSERPTAAQVLDSRIPCCDQVLNILNLYKNSGYPSPRVCRPPNKTTSSIRRYIEKWLNEGATLKINWEKPSYSTLSLQDFIAEKERSDRNNDNRTDEEIFEDRDRVEREKERERLAKKTAYDYWSKKDPEGIDKTRKNSKSSKMVKAASNSSNTKEILIATLNQTNIDEPSLNEDETQTPTFPPKNFYGTCQILCYDPVKTWAKEKQTQPCTKSILSHLDSSRGTKPITEGGALVFVIIAFIVLMGIVLAWSVTYYINRYRQQRLHHRIYKRRQQLAKKAMSKIPTKILDERDLMEDDLSRKMSDGEGLDKDILLARSLAESPDSASVLNKVRQEDQQEVHAIQMKFVAGNASKQANRKPAHNQKNVKISFKYNDTSCAICIEQHQVGDSVRILPCKHIFHKKCVDPWLLERQTCPICKCDILKAVGINTRFTVESSPVSQVQMPSIPMVRNLDSSEDPDGSHTVATGYNGQRLRNSNMAHNMNNNNNPSLNPSLNRRTQNETVWLDFANSDLSYEATVLNDDSVLRENNIKPQQVEIFEIEEEETSLLKNEDDKKHAKHDDNKQSETHTQPKSKSNTKMQKNLQKTNNNNSNTCITMTEVGPGVIDLPDSPESNLIAPPMLTKKDDKEIRKETAKIEENENNTSDTNNNKPTSFISQSYDKLTDHVLTSKEIDCSSSDREKDDHSDEVSVLIDNSDNVSEISAKAPIKI